MSVIILLLFAHNSSGQDLVLTSFVKKDIVQFRWAPRNYSDLLLGLKKGYEFKWEENGTHEALKIDPLLGRSAQMNSERQKQIYGLLKAMVTNEKEETSGDLVYAMLMIAAGPEKEIAKLCGVYHEVAREKNSAKRYQISIPGTDLKSDWLEVDHGLESKNPEMTELVAHRPKKRTSVYLEWEAEKLKKSYSGYWIEKSDDGQFFKRLNDIPYTFLKSLDQKEKTTADFLDSLVREGETYFYRIQGINHFGDPGEKSNIVEVYIPRFLKGECRIDTVFANKEERVVEGRFLFNNDSDIGNIKRFILYRSDSMFHSYSTISSTPPDRNNFSFTFLSDLYSGDKNYFKVAAISQDSDTTWSYPYYFFTLDQEPPSAPMGLAGEINDSGVVSLRWKHNPEKDIRGYRIFMANSMKEEFMEAWNEFVTDSIFHDTLSLNNLTSEVYYKVSAVDMNYNNSAYSEIVKLEKPDTIPPVPCVFKNYSQSDSGIYLQWVNSTSRDVADNRLIRRRGLEEELVLEWSTDSSISVTDSISLIAGRYEYLIETVDKRGNSTLSQTLAINYEPGYRQGLDSIFTDVDRLKKEIKLSWNLSSPQEIYSVQIYRKKGDEKFRLIKTIRTNLNNGFIDKNLSINNVYTYKVKLLYKTGISSKMSKTVEVIY